MTIATRMGVVAAALGTLALFAGSPYPAEVDAITLATWIRAQRADVRMIDLRPQDDFEAFHIPTASLESPASLLSAPAATADVVVIYADTTAVARETATSLRSRGMSRAVSLHGGVAAWIDDIMQPQISFDASASEREAFAQLSEISRYFGGAPQVLYPGDSPRPRLEPGTGDAASRAEMLAKVARMKRRGC